VMCTGLLLCTSLGNKYLKLLNCDGFAPRTGAVHELGNVAGWFQAGKEEEAQGRDRSCPATNILRLSRLVLLIARMSPSRVSSCPTAMVPLALASSWNSSTEFTEL
jgi:hypothetical protein